LVPKGAPLAPRGIPPVKPVLLRRVIVFALFECILVFADKELSPMRPSLDVPSGDLEARYMIEWIALSLVNTQFKFEGFKDTI
jgi:hypothetical protein